MLNQLEATRVIDQGVASDTCFVVIGLAEAAIDHHEFATSLDGILATTSMNGHVTIDDVACLAFYAKGIENAVAHLSAVAQLEVVALLLLKGLLISKEIALEGGHL